MFKSFFEHSKEFKELKKSVEEGQGPLYVYGMDSHFSALMAMASSVTEYGDRQGISGIILTPSEQESKEIYEFLSSLSSKVMLLPVLEMEFFGVFARSQEDKVHRSEIMGKIRKGEDFLLIASIDSVMRTLPKEVQDLEDLYLEFGMEISMEKVIESLISLGYERVDTVDSKPQFSVRGGIIDLFPVDRLNPIRMEFFGDEIDSIREFDVVSQLSIENITSVRVEAAYEGVISVDRAGDFSEKLKTICEERKGIISEKFREELLELSELLRNNCHTHDATDRFTSVLYEETVSFMDILPKNTLISLINPDRIFERYETLQRDFMSRFTNALESGRALEEQKNSFISPERLRFSLKNKVSILYDSFKKPQRLLETGETIHIFTSKASNYYSKLELLKEEIEGWKYRGFRIYICLSDMEKCKKLMESLLQLDCICNVVSVEEKFKAASTGQCYIMPISFQEGAVFPSFKTVFISEKDIFGKSINIKPRKKATKDKIINLFTELNEGDLIVHESHGIGRYIGIEQLKIEGITKDFLKIQYGGDDVLYVQPENMDSVQKYIGDEDRVKLSKLGGGDWKRAKMKAKKSVEDITDDLIKLYAQRQAVRGHEFSADTDWQMQFEEAFPFVETDDQLKCIDEIKKDMEMPRVMDRLLCGDVGYGKTEVAMRAIFKAVSDSKQAAVLAPTTILAQQHYTNMVDRFSKFPIKIEMLSRFRTKKRQEEIIRDLEAGVYDIVIGTHRILSEDVRFKDLGLLVIDEEQRFGVKHKEAIKKLKTGIDVLTMTATPIPRTLHMSLSGVRDMSVIEDPPADRYPIQTFVTEFEEEIVREAIAREVSRGGQVFFVHNQIRDIEVFAAKIQDLVPDVKVAYAHGRMPEVKLEKIMKEFMNGDFEVLISTTIVETGLDISNANTIIINNADKMGLSQLYQLRGRVGRSTRAAYAYLLYTKDKVLSEVAEKRLKAIKEFTELGSGFRIAMKDMEIRGAGDLLGAQQHGHISGVGYELYCQMINEAIMEIKGEPLPKETADTLIEFNVDAYIPSSLISVNDDKLNMYKRIAAIKTRKDMDRIAEEIEDRYGNLPFSVWNLLEVSYLRRLGKRVGALSIAGEVDGIVCRLDEMPNITGENIALLSKEYSKEFKFSAGKKPFLRLKFPKNSRSAIELLREATKMLEMILLD